MKLKKTLFVLSLLLLVTSCGGNNNSTNNNGDDGGNNIQDNNGNNGGNNDNNGGDDNNDNNDNNNGDKPVEPTPVYYTVTFETNGGSSISSLSIKEGEQLSKPTNPTKDESLFEGWYYESTLINEVSFPLTITSDLTLYAKWLNYREYFLNARDKTLNSQGYTYNDLFTIKTKVGALGVQTDGPTANRVGETYYSSTGDIKCYKHETSSGALLYDGQKHEILEGNNYRLIKQNEDGEVTKFKQETVESNYELNTSTFAKAIFEYESSDIKSITPISNTKYEIKTTANASSILTTLLNVLDSKFIATFVNALKYVDTEPTYSMYVTFTSDGYIQKYEYSYDVDVTVSGQLQNLKLTYSMNFTDYTVKTITIPTFDNLYISKDEITTKLNEVNNALSNYKNLEASSYSYKVNADVDDLAEDYSVTVKGKTVRKIENNVNYFNNYYEVDQCGYKESGTTSDVDDYDGGRGTIADGTIYNIKDPMIGYKKYEEVDSSTNLDLDYFYFLPSSSNFVANNVDYVELINKTDSKTYSFYLKENAIANILNFVSDSIRLTYTDNPHYNIFGTFSTSSIVIEESNVDVTLVSGDLSTLDIDLSGTYNTTVEGNKGNATFSCKIAIEVNDNYKEYEIPTDKKDLISSVK